ncbi:hypothetical protein [Streptomyces endophyticus]|uniref:Uncharacterized protein n=1 Tax=Streptomyces endophyticus TaxID=714166 RepID=A0ABU6F1K6_9ACTN|nr:hypothetical protein [Streptomyces endophyticus]MEB8337348.1 hypothetical protein [Streptomyces endophyticus]
MIQSGDAATASPPRLLPWSNLDGNPCYLVTDGTGASHLSRIADGIESVQLDMADDLLDHAADLLGDGKITTPQLRFLVARLTESLYDVQRIARSRGARLPVPDDCDDGESDSEDESPEVHPGH